MNKVILQLEFRFVGDSLREKYFRDFQCGGSFLRLHKGNAAMINLQFLDLIPMFQPGLAYTHKTGAMPVSSLILRPAERLAENPLDFVEGKRKAASCTLPKVFGQRQEFLAGWMNVALYGFEQFHRLRVRGWKRVGVDIVHRTIATAWVYIGIAL